MIYLWVGKNGIKLLALSKTLLGQFNVSHFQKTHGKDILEEGKVADIDLLASAIKEAITLSQPKETTERDICLILPQESFTFLRFQIPKDISERAVASFVEDKLRSTSGVNLDDTYHDFFTVSLDETTEAFVYGLSTETLQSYQKVCNLLGLKIKSVLPESLCYFKLFEKTLRSEKKENILYVYYGKDGRFGYLYDSFGLAKESGYSFGEDIEIALKRVASELEEKGKKLNRIILSGSESETVRQDHFTKSVGVWTNPLKKIILNFYEDYVRMFIISPQTELPFLDFDSCVGAFIFSHENKSFSLLTKTSHLQQNKSSRFSSKPSFSMPFIKGRDLLIFFLAFVISFSIIFSYPKISSMVKSGQLLPKQPEPTTTVTPTTPLPSPTSSPKVVKAELKIRLLNGIGVAGKAGEVKDILIDAGYEDIVTDNADRFDYTETLIRVKKDKKAAATVLQTDIADSVEIDSKDITSLDATETADIELVIGEDFQ